jgi:hypothetical protein
MAGQRMLTNFEFAMDTHHVEGAMSPNMVGSDQVRYFEFSPDGKSLYLSVKSGDRVTGKLQWDRY